MALAIDGAGEPANLRTHLRAATMAAHDLLDHAMQAANGWQTRGDYARFLALQYDVRIPLEAWLVQHAPPGFAPPPVQTALLARDLAVLGTPLPPACPRFDPGLPALCQPQGGLFHVKHGWVGAAWVLAGSALGNKSIARQVARIGGGAWPMHFLADDAMMAYWQDLRTRIEIPASGAQAAAATATASAVFAHFLAAARDGQEIDRQRESSVA